MAIGTPIDSGTAAPGTTTDTKVVLTTTRDITAGSHIIVVGYTTGARTVTTPTDNSGLGLAWQVDATINNANGSLGICSAYCASKLPSGTQITIPMGVSQNASRAALAMEVSGLDTTSWFDKSANFNAAAQAGWDTGTTATTSQATEIALAFAAEAGSSATTSTVSTGGYAELHDFVNGAGRCLTSAYLQLSGTGAQRCQGTFTTSIGSVAGIIGTYKAAGATNWTNPLSDTLSLSDSRSSTAGKVLAETPALADAISNKPHSFLADTLALADASIRSPVKIITEALSLADSRVSAVKKALADTPALADAISNRPHSFLADTLALADASVRAPVKILTEAISLADANVSIVKKAVADTLALADSSARTAGKVIDDPIAAAEALAFTVKKAIDDPAAATDAISNAATKLLADSASTVDTSARAVVKSIADPAALTDATSSRVGKLIADALALVDKIKNLFPMPRQPPPLGGYELTASPTGGAATEPSRGGTTDFMVGAANPEFSTGSKPLEPLFGGVISEVSTGGNDDP
jgi:hypothetical protein